MEAKTFFTCIMSSLHIQRMIIISSIKYSSKSSSLHYQSHQQQQQHSPTHYTQPLTCTHKSLSLNIFTDRDGERDRPSVLHFIHRRHHYHYMVIFVNKNCDITLTPVTFSHILNLRPFLISTAHLFMYVRERNQMHKT